MELRELSAADLQVAEGGWNGALILRDTATGAGLGAGIGASAGGVGAAIGGAIGAAVGFLVGLFDGGDPAGAH